MATPSNTSLVRPGLVTPYKKQIPTIKQKLRQKIRPLKNADIRRARLPYPEAVVFELYETGFPNSGNLLEQLFEFERNKNLPEGLKIIKLTSSKNIIDKIAAELKRAELECRAQNKSKEIVFLLQLANDLSDVHKDLLWMTDQLFLIALNEASNYKLDGGRLEAQCRYFYGNFLTEKSLLIS